MADKKISANVPVKIYNKAKEIAEKDGRNISGVVRILLEKYTKGEIIVNTVVLQKKINK